MLFTPAVMPLFSGRLAAEKFSVTVFCRPISLDPEMVEILVFERWETDPKFPEVPSRLLPSH